MKKLKLTASQLEQYRRLRAEDNLTHSEALLSLGLSIKSKKDNAAYRNFIKLLHFTKTNKEAAKRLGVSDRTIRRWKADGIPIKNQVAHNKKIKNVLTGLRVREENLPIEKRIVPRSIFYWQSFFSGAPRIKRWLVDGAEYDELLHIILRECSVEYAPDVPWFSSFSFVLKFTSPFVGLWDGENFTSEDDLKQLTSREKIEARKNGSWIDSATSQFISSRRQSLDTDKCKHDPQEYIEFLNKYFYSKYTEIYEIKFFEWRRFEDE